jgi:gliding motility-associated-like protein
MKVVKFLFLIFSVFNIIVISAQFLEDDFESPTSNWNTYNSGSTNNYFCIGSSIYSIKDNSLQVCTYSDLESFNKGYTYANNVQSEIVYRYINTANYYNIQVGFDWKCNGEQDRDYGTLQFSFDGVNWQALKNYQSGKGDEVSTESIKVPKCSENSGFFIGFSFTSDNSFNFQPGLVIDNFKVFGNTCLASSKPKAPSPSKITVTECFNDKDSVSLSVNSPTENLRWYLSNSCGDYIYEGLKFNLLPTESKVFYVSSFNPNTGCESATKSEVSLNVLELPKLLDPVVVKAIYGNDGSIEATASGAEPLKFLWSLDSDPNFKKSSLNIDSLNRGNYKLIMYAANNCQDSFKIVVLSGEDLDIPKGISPNNDGANDIWIIRGIQQWEDFSVELRTMRGELVYLQDASINPIYVPMDGKDVNGTNLPSGDYSYVIQSKSRKRNYSGILSIKYD